MKIKKLLVWLITFSVAGALLFVQYTELIIPNPFRYHEYSGDNGVANIDQYGEPFSSSDNYPFYAFEIILSLVIAALMLYAFLKLLSLFINNKGLKIVIAVLFIIFYVIGVSLLDFALNFGERSPMADEVQNELLKHN